MFKEFINAFMLPLNCTSLYVLRPEVPIKAVFSLWLSTTSARKVVPAKTGQQGVQKDVNQKGTSH